MRHRDFVMRLGTWFDGNGLPPNVLLRILELSDYNLDLLRVNRFMRSLPAHQRAAALGEPNMTDMFAGARWFDEIRAVPLVVRTARPPTGASGAR